MTTSNQVKDAITRFLAEQHEKKAAPELKALEKLNDENDSAKISKLNAKLAKLKEKYQLDAWMQEAALRMAKQLRFGTHISKGVHPYSQGDNVTFNSSPDLPQGLVASQTLLNLSIDANGNAAALPLAAFFDTIVNESADIRMRDLISTTDPSLEGAFSTDPQQSTEYAQHFKAALDNTLSNPCSDELNKQLLWPLSNAVTEDRYVTIIPLYPAALVHQFYHKLNETRFGEENMQARENNKKKGAEKLPYVSINDLAALQLGGAQPQNVGQLTNKQRGRNYLIPSLPPIFEAKLNYRVSKSQRTLFERGLIQFCRLGMSQLYDVILEEKNNIDVRNARKEAVDLIIAEIFHLAEQIQKTHPKGWSKEHELAAAEKLWLDPNREEIEGEEEFSKQRAANHWQQTIAEKFALWLNERLQARFKDMASHFGDAEFHEWKKEMENAINASFRTGEEIFA